MTTYTFFDLQTGRNTGRHFTGEGESLLKLNTPPGCVALEGAHDPLVHDLDPTHMKLVRAAKPEGTEATDWAWDDAQGRWVQTLTTLAVERQVRATRQRLLADTDWVVTRAAERGEPVDPAMAAYRQALRDVPVQAGFPRSVSWPAKPE